MTVQRRTRSHRPVVGLCLVVIGTVHVLVAPWVVGDPIDSLLSGGVIAAVDREPGLASLRALGFWYVTTGLALAMFGALVVSFERTTGRVPRSVAWSLVGVAVWGIVLIPASPFWVILLVSLLAFRASRRVDGQSARV